MTQQLQQISIAEAFALEGVPATVTTLGFEAGDNPLVPRRDENYVFDRDRLRAVLAYTGNPLGDAMWLGGPYGSGKTSLITQTLARLNWPTITFSWHARREFADLVGHMGIRDGQTVFQHGPLALAMIHGYALVINEIDRGHPGELIGLNDVLEGQPLVIPETGEVIRPAETFRLFVTANSMGSGDDTGLFAGSVNQLDPAFLDRFRALHVDYPPVQVEDDIIARLVPNLSADIRVKMIETAGELRRLFVGHDQDGGGELTVTMSTRTLLRWANLTVQFRSAPNAVAYALNLAFTNRCRPSEAQAIRSIAEAKFGGTW